jgi:hypothetical protein
VARLRERLDASAPRGIPAHITVLFPFMPPGTAGGRWTKAATFALA